MSAQFQQSKQNTSEVPQPSAQQALPPGWTVKPENSETSRKLIKWFADRGLEAHIAIAEGPAGRPLTYEEYKAVEEYAHRLNVFDDPASLQGRAADFNPNPTWSDPNQALRQGMPAPTHEAEVTAANWKKFRETTTLYPEPQLAYGQLAQAAAVAPAGKPNVKGLEKQLAEDDWRKRRPQVMDALDEVFAEVKRSLDKHGGFRSGHEGYAVLKEEVDELWDEIKNDNSGGVEARTEAIQIAAMAVKYAVYIAGNSR